MRSEPWGVVLAGGRSRRLGYDKARVRLGTSTLLERAVATLACVFGEVAVVGRFESGLPGVEAIPDRLSGEGPLGGILTALESRPGRPVFVLACDLPLATPELVRGLLAHASTAPTAQVCCAAAGARVQPLCALWKAECGPAISSALARGERPVLDLLGRLETLLFELPQRGAGLQAEALTNLNRPGDLAAVGARPPAEIGHR